jgi:hypothetical protein
MNGADYLLSVLGQVDTQPAGHPLALPKGPQPLETLDQDGVVGEGFGHVDDLV